MESEAEKLRTGYERSAEAIAENAEMKVQMFFLTLENLLSYLVWIKIQWNKQKYFTSSDVETENEFGYYFTIIRLSIKYKFYCLIYIWLRQHILHFIMEASRNVLRDKVELTRNWTLFTAIWLCEI